MSDETYLTNDTEEWMINCLYRTIDQIRSGQIDAVGVCAASKDGTPSFIYYNQPASPVLRPAMSRLLGLYEINNRKNAGMINAPRDNRSYGTH